jgi:tRNA-2-methylthio-N6-dimethylallyladenosine synthase
MVGAQTRELEARFPYVDVFMRPQEFDPLLRLLEERFGMSTEGCLSNQIPQSPGVSGYVPVIHGCDLMCTFCVIPFRRGRQVSRSMEELVREVGLMARRGMREVTLLGQTVDAYGHDLEEKVDLADLLREVALVPELARVRFLTSHPIFMTDRIIETVRDTDKVCEHINLPVQAADDEILDAMRRRYSGDEYRRIIERIRDLVPNVAISTDVIVGFPGETRDQFNRTLDLVRDIEFHKVHTAVYSPRPGTYALRRLPDDVSPEEKEDRFRALEEVQRGIQERNNAALLGATLEVLVDDKKKGRWKGRTLSDKLVFFEDDRDLLGELVDVKIVRTSPWSLGGEVVDLPTLQKAGVP